MKKEKKYPVVGTGPPKIEGVTKEFKDVLPKIKEERKVLLTVNVPLVIGFGLQELKVPDLYKSAHLAVEETLRFCLPETKKVLFTLKVMGKKRGKPLEILVDFPK